MIYLTLFWTFFQIGAFTFGGGYAMLPLIQEEVLANGWLTNEELINFIAISESTPGPFAVNISTYVGMEKAGILGAICSTLGVVLPSFIIIILIAAIFTRLKDNHVVKGIMSGLKPAVIGLIASAIISVGKTVFIKDGFDLALLETPDFWCSIVIFAAMVILIIKKVHPIIIIGISALTGILAGLLFSI